MRLWSISLKYLDQKGLTAVWREALLAKDTGITRKDIVKNHYNVYGRPVADWFLRQQIIPVLESVGLLVQEPNPEDKRQMLIFLSGTQYNSISENTEQTCIPRYSELDMGLNTEQGVRP